jgi:hypothetical protein
MEKSITLCLWWSTLLICIRSFYFRSSVPGGMVDFEEEEEGVFGMRYAIGVNN